MKIALAQINPTVGALANNCDKLIAFARKAHSRGADLVIFPEMSICGYPARDLVERPEFVAESQEWMKKASLEVPEVAILCGCATPAAAATGKRVHNSALVLQAGEIIFRQSKMLLPTYDVFDELRNFAPAEQQRTWSYRGRRIAVTICEDAWNDKGFWPKQNTRLLYPRDPVEEQLRTGADFLINISASPYSAGKIGIRQEMLSAIAREYRVPVVFVNQVGGNDQLIFDGCSMVLGEEGTLCARAACFEEDLIVVQAGDWRGDLRPAPATELEAMEQALVLGTRDFVRKCGFERVLVGLSGGIDSALTAAIAVDALGASQVSAVYMPSRYSSEQSGVDARVVASNLGIELREMPIEPLFSAALAETEDAMAATELEPDGRRRADLAHQNIQSRLRSLMLMTVSNLSGALVLATGNKSELATGYCTLYGDMAGGLGVIADVLKTQVYELAHLMNRRRKVFPESVLTRDPTAELKFDQRDCDDLPPYSVLDSVVREYVENSRSSEEIAAELELDPAQVHALIRRIDHSEYKRQQAPPGLKVSKKAFGMGRRLPIAQRYQAPLVPSDCLPVR